MSESKSATRCNELSKLFSRILRRYLTSYSRSSNALPWAGFSSPSIQVAAPHLSFVQVSWKRWSWPARVCEPSVGSKRAISLILIFSLNSTSRALSGSSGVAITISSYFEPTDCSEWFKTSVPAKYDSRVSNVTKAAFIEEKEALALRDSPRTVSNFNPVAAADAASVPDSQLEKVESDDGVTQKSGKN